MRLGGEVDGERGGFDVVEVEEPILRLGDNLLRYHQDIAALQGRALIPRGVGDEIAEGFAAGYFRDFGYAYDFQAWDVVHACVLRNGG